MVNSKPILWILFMREKAQNLFRNQVYVPVLEIYQVWNSVWYKFQILSNQRKDHSILCKFSTIYESYIAYDSKSFF